MKITEVSVKNFGSFREYCFKPRQGGTLVSGPTGSGKSTIFDMIPWVLFGETAKNGAVDEVRMWGTKETFVTINFTVRGEEYTVVRTRCPNDLYIIRDGVTIRGSTLVDTQKKINEIIGLSADTFLAGCYLHEFSKTSNFFYANAKDRRKLMEDLADLSFPTKLAASLATYKKSITESHKQLDASILVCNSELNSLTRFLVQAKNDKMEWDNRQKDLKAHYREQNDQFLSTKALKVVEIEKRFSRWASEKEAKIHNKILLRTAFIKGMTDTDYDSELSKIDIEIRKESQHKCPTCGGPFHSSRMSDLAQKRETLLSASHKEKTCRLQIGTIDRQIEELELSSNPYAQELASAKESQNPYAERLAEDDVNPHVKSSTELSEKVKASELELARLEKDLAANIEAQSNIRTLVDVLADLRASLIETTVRQLETLTNEVMSEYFDGELRVSFQVEDADKVSVSLYKDGNTCSFTQLSRGQRQILKLSFGIAIMKVIHDHHAINKQYLFFDECLTGMDEVFKSKAVRLFESLATEYPGIYVVEHSTEFKEHFPSRIEVTNFDGESRACQL